MALSARAVNVLRRYLGRWNLGVDAQPKGIPWSIRKSLTYKELCSLPNCGKVTALEIIGWLGTIEPRIVGRGGHYRQLMLEGCDPDANLIAIGHCGDREKEAIAHGGPFGKWISPGAQVYTKDIGEGSQVMAGAVVYAPLGKHCIVGTNAVVSHDVVCEDFVFIGPGAVVTGYCVLRRGCFIGAGAVVTPRTEVPAGMLLKAGALMKPNGDSYTVEPHDALRKPLPGTP